MQIAISILLKCTLVRKTSFHALKVRTIHHMERSFSAHQNEAWESFSTTKWSTWWHFSILHLDVVAWWWWWWRLRFWFYQRKREANSMEEALELLVKCLLSCHSTKILFRKKMYYNLFYNFLAIIIYVKLIVQWHDHLQVLIIFRF